MDKNSKIFVAGHKGLLGSALCKILRAEGYNNIFVKPRTELELTDKRAVFSFFEGEKPEIVFLAAGKVGGIIGNRTYPADFLHINIAIQDNCFEAANQFEVQHLVFYGSSCTYPKICPQPMKEEYWLGGPLEETSLGYAAAKIAGMVACRAYNEQYKKKRFICLLPNSMYGANDCFDLENSHVLSALIKKFHEAKIHKSSRVTLWGTGKPRREFIFSEDVAKASIFAVKNVDKLENRHYNIGSGEDISIEELAAKIAQVVGFEGMIEWDTSKPDGSPSKLLDSSRFLALGWRSEVEFDQGLVLAHQWYNSTSR
jgi:GDP-L-fucose synthase